MILGSIVLVEEQGHHLWESVSIREPPSFEGVNDKVAGDLGGAAIEE